MQPDAAARELRAVELLLDNQFKTQHPRGPTGGFSGSVGDSWGFAQLSSAAQNKFIQARLRRRSGSQSRAQGSKFLRSLARRDA